MIRKDLVLSLETLVSCLCFFLLAAYPIQAAAEPVASGTPKITTKSSVYNFGEVMQGTKVSHSFLIQNEGDAPLTIDRIEAACGCTAANPAHEVLAPGEYTTIDAVFDTTGFHGEKVKTIRVYSDDPKNSSIEFAFQGVVTRELDIDPPRLYFGNVRKGKIPVKSAFLRSHPESKVEIKDIRTRSQQIILEVKDVSIPKPGKKLTVKLDESVPVGIFRGRVSVHTNSKTTPVYNIPVFARIVGDLMLQPTELNFGLMEGPLDKVVEQRVRLKNDGSANINILSVKNSSPSLKVSIEKVEGGKEYEFVVALQEGAVGPLRDRVEIVTDHPDKEQSKVSFPVYGIIARKGE